MSEVMYIEDLRFRYRRSNVESGEYDLVVQDAISIADDTVYSIKGDNMSGKSTLVRLLTGVIPRSEIGAINTDYKYRLNNQEESLPVRSGKIVRKGIRTVHQNNKMFMDLSIEENIESGRPFINDLLLPRLALWSEHNFWEPLDPKHGDNRGRVREYLSNLLENLNEAENSTRQIEADFPLGKLSGGGQMLVNLARAMAWPYRVLILDEPTGNLDSTNSEKVFEILKNELEKRSVSVVLISHNKADHSQLQSIAEELSLEYRAYVANGGLIGAEC